MNLCSILFSPEFGFIRLSLLIGILAAPAIGVVGTLVVTKRISSLAGASAHAALGGVGLALFAQRTMSMQWADPLLGAVLGAVAAAVAVGAVSMRCREREDTAIGAVWAIGMALGLLALDRTPGYVDWQGYLFGNILLISKPDVWMAVALDAVVLVPAAIWYEKLLALSFDPTFARLRGVKTTAIYLVQLAITALTIVLLMRLVGIILVIALLTLPAATAGMFTRHLWSMMLGTAAISGTATTAGLLASMSLGTPAGPTIVVFAGAVYVIGLVARRVRSK